MQQFARLMPYLWQHRWKLYVSMGFALVVALLWAATLSLTFLVVKVLLQDQSLQQYIEVEAATCEVEIEKRQLELDELDRQLEARGFATQPVASDKEILRQQDRSTRKLSSARQRLVACRWIQRHLMPWVPNDQFQTYAWILLILLIGTALKGTAMFIQEMLVGSVVELAIMALRKDCFRHALELDYQSLMRHGKPELMSRFTNDVGVASDGLNLLGGRIVREPLKALACIAVAFWVSWQLTMLSMVCVPVMAVIFHRYGMLLKRASHHMMERMSRIYKSLEETFDGLKVVIAFRGERRHRQRFHRENKDYYHQAMKVVQIDALTGPTTELLLTIAVCVSMLPGAFLVLRHEDAIWGIKLASEPMLIEDLSMFYALLAGTLDPVRKLSSIYSKLKRSAAATERIFQILDWQPALKQVEHPQHMPRHSQSISFKKVSFQYDSDGVDRPNALTDVTLKVAAGEVVVVVGENGSGKSTLVNLLPRFYDPNSGSVQIDGIDIRNVRLRDLRAQIGVVTQETLLFDDTIYETGRDARRSARRRREGACAAILRSTPGRLRDSRRRTRRSTLRRTTATSRVGSRAAYRSDHSDSG